MAFLTGLILIDAPASALNNAGAVEGARTDNMVAVKAISTREGSYPYVSAQALRYWLRHTLEQKVGGWVPAPILRESKVAYTDANPIRYWDDDLFGYMRAPGKSDKAKASREGAELTDVAGKGTLTRVSPLRVGTLVSIAPMKPTQDFGTMSRHEGNPVPFEHEFYRTTLKGAISLDMGASGVFGYADRTGFLNLDDNRVKEAQAIDLAHDEKAKTYTLPIEQRRERVAALLSGLAQLEGGANQTLHYTDVSPAVIIAAVTKGGNHPFAYCIGPDAKGLPKLNTEALDEAVNVLNSQLLSPIYVGWKTGFCDAESARMAEWTQGRSEGPEVVIDHPKLCFERIAQDINNPANSAWFER